MAGQLDHAFAARRQDGHPCPADGRVANHADSAVAIIGAALRSGERCAKVAHDSPLGARVLDAGEKTDRCCRINGRELEQ